MSDSIITTILSKIPLPDPPVFTSDNQKDQELLTIFNSNLDNYKNSLDTLCSTVFTNALTNSRHLSNVLKNYQDIKSAVEKDLSRLSSGFDVKFTIDLLNCKKMSIRIPKDRLLNDYSIISDAKIAYIEDTRSVCVLRLNQETPNFSISECPCCEENTISSKVELINHIKKTHIIFKKSKKKKIEQDFKFEKVEFGNMNYDATEETIENLNSHINSICEEYKITEEISSTKESMVKFIHGKLETDLPGCELQTYGSSNNGFGTISSDIDLCLMFDPINAFKQKKYMIMLNQEIGENKTLELCELIILSKVCKALEQLKVIDLEMIEGARVKIINFKTPTQPSFSVDISVNRKVVLENTKLIKTYSLIDSRVSRVGVIVKLWAKSQGICDSKNGTLSSYAWILLVIFFFQHRPAPILPCLQEGVTFKKIVDGFDCAFNENYSSFVDKAKAIPDSEGDLILDFFYFYSWFDWKNNSVDIRKKANMKKLQRDMNLLISIQDPFESLRNLGDIIKDQDACHKIINCFKKTFMELSRGISLMTLIGDLGEY